MMKNLIPALLATAALSACAPPIESVSTRISEASSIKLINAPDGTYLRTDGQSSVANKGTAVLKVSDGWHDVSVEHHGVVELRRRVFVQDGSVKVIDFTSPE